MEIKEYPGTYEEYEIWQSKRVPKLEKKVEKKVVKEEPKKEKVQPSDDTKKILLRKNKELSALEQKIAEKEQLVKALEIDLANEDIYADAVKLQEVTRNYNSTKAEFDQLQEQWENLAEEIMTLEA